MNAVESDSKGFIMLSFSPDGTRIVSVSEDDIVCMWNASREKLIAALEYEADRTTFPPNGDFVALAQSWSNSKEESVIAV